MIHGLLNTSKVIRNDVFGASYIQKRDKAQNAMDELYLPFGDELDANNRWVKIARVMAYLAETGKTEAALIIPSMNLAHLLRLFFKPFLARAKEREMV